MKTPVTALLSVALVAAYGLELASGGEAACSSYGFTAVHASLGTAFTSLFLHDPGSVGHLGGNLVFLVVFGTIVERAVGSLRFLALYLGAGLVGAATHALVDPSATAPLVGASGAIFGLLALGGVLRPRLLGFVGAFVALNIWYAVAGTDGNVSYGAHIGGFVLGVLAVAAMRLAGSEALEDA